MLGKKLIQAASGSAAGGGLGIEDVFSTWLYTGNGSTQTITNGIDLAGEGGLVWIKHRAGSIGNPLWFRHFLYDSERGLTNTSYLHTDRTDLEGQSGLFGAPTFLNDGFTTGSHVQAGLTYTSWTFRKAPGFFDVVTYTGDGSNRTIAHSLGSVPGTIIVKRTDTSADWQVYHRSLANTEYLVLNSAASKATGTTRWNSTTPTSTVFSLGTDTTVNASGGTYVAYLFAHDEQIFGESGDQSVIKCGSVVTNAGTGKASVNLGWEPQWLLIKVSSTAGYNWFLCDNMRGVATPANTASNPVVSNLFPNLSNAEDTAGYQAYFTPTGFEITGSQGAGTTVVYIAIRRGPMKTPTSGTEVFLPSVTARNIEYTVGFPPDMAISKTRLATDPNWVGDRLRGNYPTLKTESTAAEQTGFLSWTFDATTGRWKDILSNDPIQYLFRRAPGFFDVVAYTGTGGTQNVPHSLTVAPEFVIHKTRSDVFEWWCWHSGLGSVDKYIQLQSNAAAGSSGGLWGTGPTSSQFTVTSGLSTLGRTFVVYLFATCPGVSKVFSFTGNGTSQTIDCGFAAGARFVLLKRTDSAGNWLVADTARGIISGNDPLLYLNSAAAEITTLDWIDPHSSGFIVNQEATANANVGGATYIGLAIA